MRVRPVAALAALLLAAGAAAGCGDDDEPTSATVVQAPTSAVEPATTTTALPTTTTPAPTATEPTATTGVPPAGGSGDTGGTPAGEETEQGGGGDEEAARVPAAFTIEAGRIAPARITVPAFLAIDLRLTARGEAQRVTVAAPGAGSFDVAAGGTARRVLEGLRPGDYAVTTASGARATLRVTSGGDAGP